MTRPLLLLCLSFCPCLFGIAKAAGQQIVYSDSTHVKTNEHWKHKELANFAQKTRESRLNAVASNSRSRPGIEHWNSYFACLNFGIFKGSKKIQTLQSLFRNYGAKRIQTLQSLFRNYGAKRIQTLQSLFRNFGANKNFTTCCMFQKESSPEQQI